MAQHDLTYYRYPTPLGTVTIAATSRGICQLTFGEPEIANAAFRPSLLTNQAANELLEYLAGKRRAFDVALDPAGSGFQRSVWQAVREIPYGTHATSTDIARALGNPSANRSVGAAVTRNPVAVIVPAHRVVRANGSPLGAGTMANHQAKLLEFEQLQLARRG